MITTTAVLKKTLVVLKKRGWCQGAFEKPDGTCCLVGAIDIAIESFGDTQIDRQVRRAAYDRIAKTLNVVALSAWNDIPERTQVQVEKAIQKAIKLEARS